MVIGRWDFFCKADEAEGFSRLEIDLCRAAFHANFLQRDRVRSGRESDAAAALAELITLGEEILSIDEDAGRAIARRDCIDDAEEADIGRTFFSDGGKHACEHAKCGGEDFRNRFHAEF